jgi:dienelactone hydrolase
MDFPAMSLRVSRSVVAFLTASIFGSLLPNAAFAEPEIRRGEVKFEPVASEDTAVPEPFRLAGKTFAFEQTPQPAWGSGVEVSLVTFPSPVVTPHTNNNTVHCEYFRPAKPGKYPACIVLHILGGDFPLARVFANHLAEHGVAALFVKMPYYGERRDPNSAVRMVSTNPEETVQGMTQAVKDIRYATAWLASQDEVDAKQIGIFGISLGGITASLAATAEPRLTKICPVLAGGDLNRILSETQERHILAAKQTWTDGGHSLQELVDLMKTIDPCTYGACVKGRKVLMLNAKNDEIIPRQCTDSLWESFGRPPIFWYDCGHYTAVFHITDALNRVADFFATADDAKPEAAPAN